MKEERNGNYNSRKAIKNLQSAYEKHDRGKYILVIAVALTIVALFTVFSLVFGKINTDIIRNIREDGIGSRTYLINGMEEDAERLERLDYVGEVGRQKQAGGLFRNAERFAVCMYADEETFRNMIEIAYTDVQGEYPKKSNEIMLSKAMLDSLGIANPQIGMELTLEFHWDDWSLDGKNGGEKKFILSGYFEEYCTRQSDKMKAYISRQMLEDAGAKMYPLTLVIDIKPWYLNRDQVEKKLYQNVSLEEEQWFISYDSAQYRAAENVFGGFGTAICLGIVVLLSMYLLVYNIWSISINKDIRQYGTMEVLGIGYKQIVKMLKKQSFKIWIKGSIAGGGAASILILLIMPHLLRKMYLGNAGSMENIRVFYPQLLLAVIVFAGISLYIATSLAARKLQKLSPLEAMKFEEADHYTDHASYEKKRGKKGPALKEIARRNVLRSKRKFVITVLSLILGCTVGLCAIVITDGLDVIHKLQSNPDFTISLTPEVCAEAYRSENPGMVNSGIFTDADVDELADVIGSEPEQKEVIYGNLIVFGEGLNECVYQVLNIPGGTRNASVIVEALSDEKLENLKEYIDDKQLPIDEETFENELGFLVGHRHFASNDDPYTVKKKGMKTAAYKFSGHGEMTDESTRIDLINCGYLDLTEREIPDLGIVWDSEEIIYFLVTEQTMEKLSEISSKQVLQVSFDVEENKEAQAKKALNQWLEEKNMEFQNQYATEVDRLSITSNSDIIAKESNYIEGSRTIMFLISAILVFVGIINYFSTIITEIFTRKREFAIMESIGMTRKQLQKMLTLEGVYYCKVVMLFLLTAGNGILLIIELIMKAKTEYFQYTYPIAAVVLVCAALSLICAAVPRIIYKKTVDKSVIERMRNV